MRRILDTSIIFQSRTNLLATLVKVAKELTSERNSDRLLEKIVEETRAVTNADGGTLYLVKGDDQEKKLAFEIIQNSSLDIQLGGTTGKPIDLLPIPLYLEDGKPNHKNIVTHTVLTKKIVTIVNAYKTREFDFSGTKAFDENMGYKSTSFLSIPLLDHQNEVIGVIQLVNAKSDHDASKTIPFNPEIQPIVEALASYAAIALENQIVLKEQKDLLVSLSSEPNTACLIERILKESQKVTNADGGTLYLIKKIDGVKKLEFAIMKNNSLGISKGGAGGEKITIPAIPLYDESGNPNHHNIATYTALTKEMVNVKDAYHYGSFDFSGVRKFDKSNNYNSKSFLTVPLLNHEDDVIGVIQLVNAMDPNTGEAIAFTKQLESIVDGLASYAAIALDNEILLQDHKDLLDAFIKCIAKAIDAKSPHTSGHCQRVPALTKMIAKAACEDQTEFKDFNLDVDGWYELHVASWMHDCGKLSTPDILLDKSTKLHLFQDSIGEVSLRMEVMKKDLQLEIMNKIVDKPEDKEALLGEMKDESEKLDVIRSFIQKANVGGEFMSEEKQEKIKEYAALEWKDSEGNIKNLLTEHEVKNLCIAKGTLTADEREEINNHMVVTIDMLESLPFPNKLARVPEYAGGHHEKMNGTGFPKGLKRHEMSIPARMMAIADIFEALTAKDRPYKKPMPISLSLKILNNMKKDEHVDPDILDLFIRSKVWKIYAEKYLNEDQLDIEDGSDYL
ncbi:MAG: hypothetical protein COA79_08035 [Planctomycetota bacterium]|nr:MAG: hypothetical protein COA79_08035 [Planctomycetota bacterium]